MKFMIVKSWYVKVRTGVKERGKEKAERRVREGSPMLCMPACLQERLPAHSLSFSPPLPCHIGLSASFPPISSSLALSRAKHRPRPKARQNELNPQLHI